jgi:hypothetical protein
LAFVATPPASGLPAAEIRDVACDWIFILDDLLARIPTYVWQIENNHLIGVINFY